MKYICMVCQKTYKVDDVASPVKGLDYSHGVCDACEPAYRAQVRAELYEAGYKLKPKMVQSNSHVVEEVDNFQDESIAAGGDELSESGYGVAVFFVLLMLTIFVIITIACWNS